MRVHYHGQTIRFAVCIPSRGRGARVSRMWQRKMNFLDAPGVFFGVDKDGAKDYSVLVKKANWFEITNPTGSVSCAREQVRRRAMSAPGRYQTVVLTDDNATFTRDSLNALVRAQVAYQTKVGEPVVMGGLHGTAAHWDKDKVDDAATVNGTRSYERVSMMFWAMPANLYEQYRHPDDAYGYDDRHLVLWLISQGVRHFRVTPDAPFSKARYQLGGQGRIEERIEKNTNGTLCLLRDFPDYMGLFDPAIPWKTVLKYETAGLQTRLGGRNAR